MEHIERIIHLLQQSELTQEEYNQIILPAVNYLINKIKEELEQAYAVGNYKKVGELAKILDKVSESSEPKFKPLTAAQINKLASNLKYGRDDLRAISTAQI